MNDSTTCDYGDCTRDDVARYEGNDPPAGTFRFWACSRHAPDVDPVDPSDPRDTGCSA